MPRLQGMELTFRRTLLERLLPLGVGFHDADLSVAERQLVGQAFRDAEIPVLVRARTMAQGVTLPAQTIIFIGWGKQPRRRGRTEAHLGTGNGSRRRSHPRPDLPGATDGGAH
jgi:hypothetical protein